MLRAFAMLMSYSYRLNALPVLKLKFWKWVLRSSMLKWNENTSPRWKRIEEDGGESDEDDPDNYNADRLSRGLYRVEPWMLEEPGIPCFAVSIDLRDTTSSVETLAFDAVLLRLMMTAPANTHHYASTTGRIVAFDFKPVLWKPTVKTLESLKAYFGQVYKHPDRQFEINMLEMSMATRKSATCDIVMRIIKKINCGIYQIYEVMLDHIATKSSSEKDLASTDPLLTSLFAVALPPDIFATSRSPGR